MLAMEGSKQHGFGGAIAYVFGKTWRTLVEPDGSFKATHSLGWTNDEGMLFTRFS